MFIFFGRYSLNRFIIRSANMGFFVVALTFTGQAVYSASSDEALDFKSALKIALSEDPRVSSAVASIRSADASIEVAEWQYWPTPSVVHKILPDPVGTIVPTNTNRHTTTLTLNQPLWAGGSIDAGLDKAKAGKRESEATLQKVRFTIALELVDAYGKLYSAKKSLDAHSENIAIHAELLSQINRRVNSGLSPASDMRLAQARMSSSRSKQVYAQIKYDKAKADIYAIINRDVALDYESFANNELEWHDQAGHIESALAIDPQMDFLHASILKLRAGVKEIKANAWPRLSAELKQTYGDVTGSTREPSVEIKADSRWTAGLSLAATAKAAEQRIQTVYGDIDRQERNTIKEVKSDYVYVKSAQKNIEALEGAVAATSSIYDSWQRQFRAGRKSWQQLLDVALENATTKTELADSIATLYTASWRLAARVYGVDWLIGNETQENGSKVQFPYTGTWY